jgi:hypothetical protein
MRIAHSHENSQTKYALFADQTHLECGAPVDSGKQRDNSTVGEIDVTNQNVRLVENLLEYQRDFF